MASYQDKINQKRMSTESGKIAWCIDFMQHPPLNFNNDYYEELRNGIDLFDDISVYEDGFVYVVWRPVHSKGNRYLNKYLQISMSYDQMVKMLDAQPWQYI